MCIREIMEDCGTAWEGNEARKATYIDTEALIGLAKQ